MNKNDMRQAMQRRLKQMDKLEKNQRDYNLCQFFLASPIYQQCQTLALFLSMAFEVDTSPILEQALLDGKKVLVPKTYVGGRMDFLPYDGKSLVTSQFGLREPTRGDAFDKQAIDVILVPGLIWNDSGHRIGFGAGFYDRYLADFTGKTVSLIYDFQRINFKAEPHDIAVREVFDDKASWKKL